MQWGIILALAFALLIAAFAVVNMDTITVNFLFGEASIPLVLVIIGATFAGAIIVASFNIANQLSSYRKIKKLEQEIDILELQLQETTPYLDETNGIDAIKETITDSPADSVGIEHSDDEWDQLGAVNTSAEVADDDKYLSKVQIEMEDEDNETDAIEEKDKKPHL